MTAHLRIARPVRNLALAVSMYRHGLGLEEIGRFEDHDGFDGVMLGNRGMYFHFEFTYCRNHPVDPAPTPEDLLIFYLPEAQEWNERCTAMLQAGFKVVEAFNPYWRRLGRMFQDPDGYRVVIQQEAWSSGSGD